MNRIIAIAAAMVAGLASAVPADASATRHEACRKAIEEGILHGRRLADPARQNPYRAWLVDPVRPDFHGSRPEVAARQGLYGVLPADMIPALGAPLMEATFLHYCREGGQMGYWAYVLTFLNTNGFYLFQEKPDGAAARLVREEGQYGSIPRPQARVLMPDHPRTHHFASLTSDMRITLPELRERIVYIAARAPMAVVMIQGRASVLWQGQWVVGYPAAR